MNVYALVGPAGTGKSHHAMEVAENMDIDHIIDDGLLIYQGKRLAGSSAKAEPTLVAAVKRAIFFDSDHAKVVRETLEAEDPKDLLILGTSEHMIDRIIGALGLPPLKKIIFISDVVTDDEMATAKAMRAEGRHVIPMPAIEVRKDLPNIWIDPIVGFFKRKGKDATKTIIRPVFSNLGRVVISEQVVVQLVAYLAKSHEALGKQIKTSVSLTDLGVLIQTDVKIRYGNPIQREVIAFQHHVAEEVEKTTGLAVRSVDVRVQGVESP